jgi:hypothetical protein
VHADRIDIGAVEQRLVRGRIIALDPFDQLELAQKLGASLVGGDLFEGFFSLVRRNRFGGGGIVRRQG